MTKPHILTEERIRSYLEAQAYRGFHISEDETRLYYFEQERPKLGSQGGAPVQLKLKRALQKLGTGGRGDFDFENAQTLSDEDFLKLSVMIAEEIPERQQLLLHMDVANEEKYNLYLLDLRTGTRRQLTREGQALMPVLSADRKSVWYNSRVPAEGGGFVSHLCRVDLDSGESASLLNDGALEDKLNFVTPCEVTKDRVFMFMDRGGRRQHFQLYDIDLRTGERKPCLPPDFAESRNYLAYHRPINGLIYFTSVKTGYDNLYVYDPASGQVRQLTHATTKNDTGLAGLGEGREPFAYQIFDRMPNRDAEVVFFDLEGREIEREVHDNVLRAVRYHGSLWVAETAMTREPRYMRLRRSLRGDQGPRLGFTTLRGGGADFIQCTREIVRYASYDGLEIPAFLFRPKGPIRAAFVIAFYGGEDYFAPKYQMYLEQGIAILSPAVRGSWGWGQEWENKLKGDLGGGEILDVIWGARFLAQTLGLPENKVGVEGGSHGGYAVLRTLTMPADFRGVNADFDFGFGLCWAGFADLEDFMRTSWISDWLVDLLGPYEGNEALYRERSPVRNFARLRTPLFVAHGKNDRRVPISTMTEFLEKLAGAKTPHRIQIQDGEGHKGGGVDKDVAAAKDEFEFLNAVLDGKV